MILASILMIEVIYLARTASASLGTGATGPKEVGIALFGPYLIGVELASMLLLAGLVGAYHLGIRKNEKTEQLEVQHDALTDERRTDAGGDLVLAGTDGSARAT